MAFIDKIWAWIIIFFYLQILNIVIALDVCENDFFFYIFSLNVELLYML